MDDITPFTATATSTPEDAISNIRTGNLFRITPTADMDDYKDRAKVVDGPQQAEPPVAQYMSQSTEHAALATPDVPKLNYASRLVKYLGAKLGDEYTAGQEAASLGFKKMMAGGNLSDEDEGRLFRLNQDQKEIAGRNYDLTGPEKPPQDIGDFDVEGGAKTAAKFLADMGAGTINFFRGIPAGAIEGQDLPSHHPGNQIKQMIGKAILGGAGMTHEMGATYNELSTATKDDGTPLNMDESTKRGISFGVGLTKTAIMGLAPEFAESAFPFFNTSMSPKFVAMAMQAPENAVMRLALNNIGHSAVTMGAMGVANEATDIVRQEMEKNYDGTHASFMNALVTASEKVMTNKDKYAERLAAAGGEQALQGALFGLGGNLLARGNMRAQVADIAAKGRDLLNNIDFISNKGAIPGAAGEPPPETGATVKNVGPKGPAGPATPWTPPSVGDEVPVDHTVNQSVDSIKTQEIFHLVNDAMRSTKMADIASEELASVIKKTFDEAGINKLYTTLTGARDFSKDEETGQKIRNIIGPTGRWQGQMNAPIALDPTDVMMIAKDHPQIFDQVSPNPEEPNPLQAKTHLENIDNAEKRREKIFADLGIKPEEISPAEETNVSPLQGKAKAEEIPYDLNADVKRTKEILDRKKEIETKLKDIEEGPKPKDPRDVNDLEFMRQNPNWKEIDSFVKNADAKIKSKLENEQTGLDRELADIKNRVTENFLKPPGKLMFGHWPEPGIQESTNAMTGYLEGPTFTEALRKALPKAEVDKIDKAQMRARQARADSIGDAAKYEMNKIHDINAEEVKEIRRQQEIDRIANDPNYAIVEKFRNTKNTQTKKSIYQIDPKSLTDGQLEYADHFRLKEHGVFARPGKGMPADAAAQMLDVKDGSELLKILAQTPTREQVADARAAANAIADEKEVRSKDDLNHTKLIEALRDTARNHLEEMKFMKGQEWPATKAGIKRIALPLPKIEELEERARQLVWKMPLKDLNPRQFEVGEARSNRVAVSAILKNEVERAFEAKEAAAMNALVEKEVRNQLGLANRTFTLARKLNTPASRQLFSDAGKLYENAKNEILDLWKLSPSAAGVSERGSYLKWVKSEIARGRGDFSIPDRLSELRQSATEMTVEQLTVIGDKLRVLYNEAKSKNKFQKMTDFRDNQRYEESLERFEAEALERLQAHPGFSDKNVPPIQKETRTWRNWRMFYQLPEKVIADRTAIIRELDIGKDYDFFHRHLEAPWENSKEMFDGLQNKDATAIKAVAKEHGSWGKISKKRVHVPEFEGIPELRNGDLSKGELMTAYANLGQQYTKDLLLENTGRVSEETWLRVLERELTDKDIDAVHKGIFQPYRDKRPLIKKLQEEEGRDVTFIEGIPITIRGITRQGGYIPVLTVEDLTPASVKSAQEFFNDERDVRDGSKYGVQYASKQTHQGYLISRTDNARPIDLSFERMFRGMSDENYDLSYRITARNFFNAMTPELYKNLIGAVGEPKAYSLVQNAFEIVSRQVRKSENWYEDGNRIVNAAMSHIGNGFAVAHLWANIHTIKIQAEAWTEFIGAQGPKAIPHIIRTNLMLLKNMGNWREILEQSFKLDPAIKNYFASAVDTAVTDVEALLPKRDSGVVATVKTAAKAGKLIGFLPIMAHDAYLKIVQAHTLQSMFFAGDHKDFPLERLATMSEDEIRETALGISRQQSHATQINNRSELQAPIQKNAITKLFTLFFNYQRRIINNTLLDWRRTRWKSNDAYEHMGKGEYTEGFKDFAGAANIFMTRNIVASAQIALHALIYGTTYVAGKKAIKSTEDLMQTAMDYFEHSTFAPWEQMTEKLPVLGTIKYAAEHKKKYQMAEVQIPLTEAFSSLSTCYDGVKNIMDMSRTHMTRMQIRGCLQAESYVMVPLPVTGWYQAQKFLQGNARVQSNPFLSTKNLEDLSHSIKEYVSNPPANVEPKYVANLEKLGKALDQQTTNVPKGTSDAIKGAMSGGNWRSPNGLYGFTPDQWKDIQKSAPELGLTDAGRIAKDTSQQEKAIDWSLNDSAKKLMAKEIPVDKATLFGAHLLGAENYEKLFNADKDDETAKVLPAAFLEKNPEIGQFKTVGQVKSYLNDRVERAHKATSETANLTKPTNNAED